MYSNDELINNPNLVLRWIQFGVFTPIFRTHATADSRIERRIWKFPNFPTILDAVRLRYSLFPYLYTMAREAYDTGISLCRPLYYDYPEADEAYEYEGQYMFGNDILVAPITTRPQANGLTEKEIWFPEGKWWSVSTNELIQGPCKRSMAFTDAQIPYFFRQGAIIPYNPPSVMNVTERPDRLVLNAVYGSDGSFCLYEDDGDNADYDTNYATTLFTQTISGDKATYVIHPRQGTCAKAPQSRSYEMHIYNSVAPLAVKVNGVAAQYLYDAASRSITFDVPTADTSSESTVVVEYPEGTAVDNASLNKPKVSYDAQKNSLVASFPQGAKNVALSVSDTSGRQMLDGTYNNVHGFSVDLSMLQPRLYISKVVADDSTYVNKFAKNK